MNKSVAVIGNCYFDEIFIIDKFPSKDVKITAKDIKITLGGSATNFCSGLIKLGMNVYLITALGNDKSGNDLIEELHLRNIRTEHIRSVEGKTGRTIILLDNDKSSTKIGFPGVCENLINSIEINEDLINQFDLIHLASVKLDMVRQVTRLNPNRFISLDFGAKTLQSSNEDILDTIEDINLVFINRTVFRRIYPEYKLSRASLKKISFPCDVVITAGSDGMYAKIKDEIFYQPIIPVDAVDTTGAGDAAAAAIIWAISQNKDWKETIKIGTIAAAMKIRTHGGSNGHPTINEILNYKNNLSNL